MGYSTPDGGYCKVYVRTDEPMFVDLLQPLLLLENDKVSLTVLVDERE